MNYVLLIKPNDDTVNLTINYRPLSIGKLRLLLTGQASFQQFQQLGFSEKDFDEVKGIFTDTNFYFLMLTVFISAVHLLLDVLTFKNDISFWRSRNSMVGLSTKTLIWRCISQAIIFLYLREEKTSLLVLLPSGLGVIIECWKLTKALKVQWTFRYGIPWPIKIGSSSKAEKRTEEIDTEAMRHLAKLMIPLCIGGAIYRLAFNTFIDDMFAFIIRMPTAHRIACFRDDIVFLIYLYQRYLYPVDKTRVNEFGETFDDEKKIEKQEKEKEAASQEYKKDR
uniref:Uncharacterized protein n=1 Tax=Panagrolaimus sp. ES5 TaxID=591445 RepID=A0AC34F367_9BILA